MNPSKPTKDFGDAVAQKIHHERVRILNPAKRYLDGVTTLPASPDARDQLLALFGKRDPRH